MSVFRETYVARGFILKNKAGQPINITDWTFEADLRIKVDDPTPVMTLNTANGGLVVTDGPNGRFELRMLADQTDDFVANTTYIFDVVRTDAVPGPIWLFSGKFKARQPVTREDV
jgi:hypothetical protein